MVSQKGGQSFAPVSLSIIDFHCIAEPGMNNFMAQACILNKGKAQNHLAEKGEGWHTVAGGQSVGDNHIMIVRIGADLVFIAIEILRRSLEVTAGKLSVFFEKH